MIDIREKLDAIGPYVPAPDDDMLVCRCEEVTKGEIRRASPCGDADHRGDKKISPVRNGIVPGTDMWQAGEGHCGKGTSCVTP